MFSMHSGENFDNCHNDVTILENTHSGGLNAMTICIGALCDNGESAVLIADRMVTDKSCFEYQIEGIETKIHRIREDCYVLDANNAQTAQQIVEKARTLSDKTTGFDAVLEAFDVIRLEKINDLFLKTRGFSFDDYKKGNIPLSIVQIIDTQIKDYKLDSSILVVSWDSLKHKYNLILIENITTSHDYTNFGMCCIGNQFQIAEFLILDSQYRKSVALQNLKPTLLKIKTQLQVFPGIGKTHDIVCLNKGQVVESTLT